MNMMMMMMSTVHTIPILILETVDFNFMYYGRLTSYMLSGRLANWYGRYVPVGTVAY